MERLATVPFRVIDVDDPAGVARRLYVKSVFDDVSYVVAVTDLVAVWWRSADEEAVEKERDRYISHAAQTNAETFEFLRENLQDEKPTTRFEIALNDAGADDDDGNADAGDIDADDRHLDLTFHSEARIAANTITISWTFACTKLARAAGAAFLRDDLIRPLLLMAQTFAAAPGHGGGAAGRAPASMATAFPSSIPESLALANTLPELSVSLAEAASVSRFFAEYADLYAAAADEANGGIGGGAGRGRAGSPKKKRKKQSRRKRTSGEAGFGSGEDDNDGGGAGGGIGDSSAAVASIGSLPTSAGAESPDLGGGPDEGDDTDAAAAAASALNTSYQESEAELRRREELEAKLAEKEKKKKKKKKKAKLFA